MSTQWNNNHIQDIIRENQILKSQVNRTLSIQVIHQQIAACFAELFPDIPPLIVSHRSQICIIQQLQYYRKTVGKWLQKQHAKMVFLIGQDQCEEQQQISTVQSLSDFQKDNSFNCYKNYGKQSDKNLLEVRIQQLQVQVQQLRTEMNQFQKQELKNLGQISYLRSITKKLQLELTEQLMVEQKLRELISKDSNKLQKELEPLRAQILVWKGEYDRLWQQNQKMKRVKTHYKFQEERTLLNTSCKDDREESNHSQLWIIRGLQFEQSYVVHAFQDNQDHSELSFTNSQRH